MGGGGEASRAAFRNVNLTSFRCKNSRTSPTNQQTENPMNTTLMLIRRGYEFIVAGGNLFQAPLLLILRAYFFWQLFMTGQGHLANIGKVSDFS
jgi:hypothetical protein